MFDPTPPEIVTAAVLVPEFVIVPIGFVEFVDMEIAPEVFCA